MTGTEHPGRSEGRDWRGIGRPERRVLLPVELAPHHPFRDTCAVLDPSGEDEVTAELNPSGGSSRGASLLSDACHRLHLAGGMTTAGRSADHTPYVILSADIRKSTFLMKEAEDLAAYAWIMTSFIEASRRIVGRYGGWFDKFMGDGFIAHWPCDLYWADPTGEGVGDHAARHLVEVSQRNMDAVDRSEHRQNAVQLPTIDDEACIRLAMASCLTAATLLIRTFEGTHKPLFRRSSRNFRADTGLTAGIDFGHVQLVHLGEEISVVGHPVVGAVRMTAVGEAGQIIGNGRVGELAKAAPRGPNDPASDFINRRFTFDGTVASTKEYEQEAYVIAARRSH